MKNQRCHGKRETLAEEDATAASNKVLGNDGLFGEILHRVDSPATLVRAAASCQRWLRRASDGAFLRRFCERHPPRLLGFYVTCGGLRPEFVPMPAPHAELRGSAIDACLAPACSSRVWDSRNGRVLFETTAAAHHGGGGGGGRRRFALRHPGGATAELPSPPPTLADECVHAMLLPDPTDGDDANTCYLVDVHHVGRSVSAEVTVLRSTGAWTALCSARARLAAAPERFPAITLLAGGRVYLVTAAGFLVAVDLATADLFAVDLPDGAAYEYFGNLVPSRGDADSVLCLVHVKGDQLSVWLRRMDGDDGEWALRDTVSVKEACGGVEKMQDAAFFPASVVGVGDNAEFVFLELGNSGVVVYLHLGRSRGRRRAAEKVYQRDPGNNGELIAVHPFFMPWPPIFPAAVAAPAPDG